MIGCGDSDLWTSSDGGGMLSVHRCVIKRGTWRRGRRLRSEGICLKYGTISVSFASLIRFLLLRQETVYAQVNELE
jgi:hypothetical protein